MKAYMAYSRESGSHEGAFLVFAHSLAEAKRLAWPAISGTLTDEFTDMAVEWLKKSEFLFQETYQWSKDKLAKDEAHVVDSPVSCKVCHLWGYELGENGMCEECAEQEQEYRDAAELDKEVK